MRHASSTIALHSIRVRSTSRQFSIAGSQSALGYGRCFKGRHWGENRHALSLPLCLSSVIWGGGWSTPRSGVGLSWATRSPRSVSRANEPGLGCPVRVVCPQGRVASSSDAPRPSAPFKAGPTTDCRVQSSDCRTYIVLHHPTSCCFVLLRLTSSCCKRR